MSFPNFMPMRPIVVDIFQSGLKWWTDQLFNRLTSHPQSQTASVAKKWQTETTDRKTAETDGEIETETDLSRVLRRFITWSFPFSK